MGGLVIENPNRARTVPCLGEEIGIQSEMEFFSAVCAAACLCSCYKLSSHTPLVVSQTLDIPATITPTGLDINRPKTISEVLDIHGSQGTPTVRHSGQRHCRLVVEASPNT